MYYVDSQRTLTRRDSSLLLTRRNLIDDKTDDGLSTVRGTSARQLYCDSTTSVVSPAYRPSGTVRKELITMMFESMLDCIVDSWEVIVPPQPEVSPLKDTELKALNEITDISKKKKGLGQKPSKTKRSGSKLEVDVVQIDPLTQAWWSSPDERAIIRFKNGNMYEGNISMKCMHGEGRYQWADGTVYIGQFHDSEIKGKGKISWKDDTWYEGEFLGNLRHGYGLYVDSRRQRLYSGDWHCGTKHGKGIIQYSASNSYDGDWVHNVRHGFGIREYCKKSGYKGEWDLCVREGKGLMIWPNHDFYNGGWKNGVMSGYGMYIWDVHCNNTMSMTLLNAYRGYWERGERHGYGTLTFGTELGAHYKGQFKNNKKHGVGKFVTNTGLILQGKNLFVDDNIGPENTDSIENIDQDNAKISSVEPLRFEMCDDTVGLLYHVEQALENIFKPAEIKTKIVNEYLENNQALERNSWISKEGMDDSPLAVNIAEIVQFERESLNKTVRFYDSDLKNIYYKYASICDTKEIQFTPILIRLYLWQFYYDCNVHDRGLNLVDIDKMFFKNPKWLARTVHNPFENIYYWQFVHSVISVASRLYAKREMPGVKPDTILSTAFTKFMDINVLPNVGRHKGYLANNCGSFIPLKGTYELYCALGEPHTIRTFLRAVRYSPHDSAKQQPPLVEIPNEDLTLGHNAFVFGHEMTYITERKIPTAKEYDEQKGLKLFNFGNLSSKGVVNIFSKIFPHIYNKGTILNLDTEITFFEFFEAFIACTEESIRVKEQEELWRDKCSNLNLSPELLLSPTTAAQTTASSSVIQKKN